MIIFTTDSPQFGFKDNLDKVCCADATFTLKSVYLATLCLCSRLAGGICFTDHFTSQFLSLLSSFNLAQHFRFPIHDKNHILYLVITSGDTSLAPAVSLTHRSPPDHFPVLTKVSINPAPLPPPTLHSFRRLHFIDIGSFLADLKSSQLIMDPSKSLVPLLIAYNTTLSSLLDRHAPIVTKLSRRQSPSNP